MVKTNRFVLILLGSLGMMSCNKKAENNASVVPASSKKYPTEKLVAQTVELQTAYPTVLQGVVDIEIKPRVQGTITQVLVDEGTYVRKGQALFKLDAPSSVQELETAKANYNTAQLDVERIRPLAEKGIVSEVMLKSYENVLTSAEAALEKAQSSISWTTVVSPIDGTVGNINYRLGSLVTSASVLTHIANTNDVVAYFSMNEKDLISFLRKLDGSSQSEKIKNIPPVKLTLADGSAYEEPGKIETISGVVSNSGAVNFRAVFPNKQGLLRSGTSGQVVIPRLLKDVFLIPQKATYFMQDKVLVYKYIDGKVSSVAVNVEATPDGKSYAVLSGLNVGDIIVTDGIATLSDGMSIEIQ